MPLDRDPARGVAANHRGEPAERLRGVGPHVRLVEIEEDVRRELHLHFECRLGGAEGLHRLVDLLDGGHDPAAPAGDADREADDLQHLRPDLERAHGTHPGDRRFGRGLRRRIPRPGIGRLRGERRRARQHQQGTCQPIAKHHES